MPQLPTFTVNVAQTSRLLASFGDQDGYKAWLRVALKDEVRRRESRTADQVHFVAKRAAEATLEDEVFGGELADPEPEAQPEAEPEVE